MRLKGGKSLRLQSKTVCSLCVLSVNKHRLAGKKRSFRSMFKTSSVEDRAYVFDWESGLCRPANRQASMWDKKRTSKGRKLTVQDSLAALRNWAIRKIKLGEQKYLHIKWSVLLSFSLKFAKEFLMCIRNLRLFSVWSSSELL